MTDRPARRRRPATAPARLRTLGVLAAGTAVVLVTACAPGLQVQPGDVVPAGVGAGVAGGPVSTPETAGTVTTGGYTLHKVEDPGPLRERLLSADVLVYSNRSFSAQERRTVQGVRGVADAMAFGLAQVAVEGRTIRVAAADPGEYRRYTLANAAQLDEIWSRVAGGEIAVEPRLGKELQRADGSMSLGNSPTAPSLHIGAFASMVPQVHAVMNPAWGEAVGMVPDNAIIVSTGTTAPQVVAEELRERLGAAASVEILGPDLDITSSQTAYLTGGSVAAAVGSFTYTPRADGTIAVDPAWVAANIRTEEVPILGRVTCHKVALPQMRAALQEIVDRGLADKIYPEQYAGCFYPRFIASDPSRGLSLHSWGIAFDINVPGNLRGTVGEIDRTVVAIFKKWGFAWGGDWSYTDPMHFELAAIVEPR